MKKVIRIINPIIFLGIIFETIRKKNNIIKSLENKSERDLRNMRLLEQWIFIKQDDKSIEDYLKKNGIKTIAIYGMGFVGERLYDELKKSTVEVKYAIDKRGGCLCEDVLVISPTEAIIPVDAIVVAAIYYFDEIKESLAKRTDIPIISLESILFEC